ncbi:MAG: TadA family conjugal transfer-associated ATPase [Bdellovibrio sp.]
MQISKFEEYDFQYELVQRFKQLFKERIYQKAKLEFDQLLEEVQMQTGIHVVQPNYLKEWFQNVYEVKWLHDAISRESEWEEIIFHDHSTGQIFFANSRKKFDIHLEATDFQLSLEILAYLCKEDWSEAKPFASFFWSSNENRFRVSLIHSCLSPLGVSKLSLRKHYNSNVQKEMQHDHASRLAFELFEAKKNIVIAGATGSGKTTLLNRMMNEIAIDEHVIILEDTSEINVTSKTWTKMLSRSEEGKSLADFCAYALRFRPDRMVIGEMRSSEIVPFLLAMNTGHKGLASTIHANSARDAFDRLKTLFSLYSQSNTINEKTLSDLISKGIDYILFMQNKKITEIIQLLGTDQGELIYEQILSAND